MSRPRRYYLERTHSFVDGWANWMVRHIESSAIGFPSCTPEATAGEGKGSGGGHSISPEVIMPEWVANVDHAVNAMPKDLHCVIVRKYIKVENVSRRKLDESLLWLSGRIIN